MSDRMRESAGEALRGWVDTDPVAVLMAEAEEREDWMLWALEVAP